MIYFDWIPDRVGNDNGRADYVVWPKSSNDAFGGLQ